MDKAQAQLVNRRHALRVIGYGVTATSGMLLAACSEGGKPAKKKDDGHGKAEKPVKKPEKAEAASKPAAAAGGGDSCNDPSKIDDGSKQLRKTLQYVEKSVKEGQNCANCMQWVPPEGGAKCGGCKLFTGPVHPNGWCLSYAPKQA